METPVSRCLAQLINWAFHITASYYETVQYSTVQYCILFHTKQAKASADRILIQSCRCMQPAHHTKNDTVISSTESSVHIQLYCIFTTAMYCIAVHTDVHLFQRQLLYSIQYCTCEWVSQYLPVCSRHGVFENSHLAKKQTKKHSGESALSSCHANAPIGATLETGDR